MAEGLHSSHDCGHALDALMALGQRPRHLGLNESKLGILTNPFQQSGNLARYFARL
jgi:hypothetical protein